MTEEETARLKECQELELCIQACLEDIDGNLRYLDTMTVPEAARALQISIPRVRQMAKEGVLTGIKGSRGVFILSSSVAERIAFIAELGHKPRRGKDKKQRKFEPKRFY